MLQFSAKAGGIKIDHVDSDNRCWVKDDRNKFYDWDPVWHHGQAGLLADKFEFRKEENIYLVHKWIDYVKNPYWRTAASYAITRAAAEIGKAMP